MFLNHNGQVLPVNTPIFGSDNRAFRYGDGLFETIRMVNGQPQFLDLHLARLQEGMQVLQLDKNEKWTIDFWQETIADLCRRNKLFKDARIKLSVYRNAAGWYTPETNTAAFLLEVWPLDTTGYQLNNKGLVIDIFTEVPKRVGALATIKSANSLPYILAGIYAKKNGLDDCLLINEQQRLVEAVASNLFLVKNNTLYTPPLTDGCVAGIMRRIICSNYSVVEQSIPMAALLEADEILLTNAIQGVQWVVGYKNKRYFNKVSKELVSLIR